MPIPLVTGISPREGCPGIKITIRGENLGIDEKDFIGLKICGDDCRATATWMSPNKIGAYAGHGQGKGDVIVTTKSGGTGFGRGVHVAPISRRCVWYQKGRSHKGKTLSSGFAARYDGRPDSPVRPLIGPCC